MFFYLKFGRKDNKNLENKHHINATPTFTILNALYMIDIQLFTNVKNS